ncbi:CBS domain-containing protein [Burkholderia sp. WAC0059]|uniref:CBS domain-containing protein n=1 Tax=Burkholderia sp. WAC0059 TaxID=2066022 RepID=UPI000C7F48D9|nr:CBS domain-containing protein [Burkholderia sp. WAC0059]PLZ04002.1 CBS domain-containing protein [Burkholderia sp. WAC0059]
MTLIREIMSRDVVLVAPETSIGYAAELMRRHDVGALPVYDGEAIVGMLTDRDLAVRALTGRYSPREPVSQVATSGVEWCYDDEDVDVVQRRMGEAQIRRVPVVDRTHAMVGTLSIGDLATRGDGAQRGRLANTLEDISQRRIGDAGLAGN